MTKEELVLFFKEHSSAFYVKEISEYFSANRSDDFKQLVKLLAALEEEGVLSINTKGQFALSQLTHKVTGTFRANEKGFGFVTVQAEEADIFIPRSETNTAMDGDIVEIEITQEASKFKEKSAEGKIIAVLERKTKTVVGTFTRYTHSQKQVIGEIKLKDNRLSDYRCFISDTGLNPVDGTVVIVEISEYPSAHRRELVGFITKEIGHQHDVGMDILSILYQLGIPTEFPEEVLQEAKAVPDKIQAEELLGRLDLRDEMIITIDGADAKDLDDAISLQVREDGTFRLGVHIADVSHYVQEHSALDKEALERGTSVYVTDRVVPMLPQRLSNGICSLHPEQERLTMSCMMDIDRSGTVYQYEIKPSVIVSKYRMTYSDVNAIFEGEDDLLDKYEPIVSLLENMKELHFILERRRKARGAIDFDTHEAKVLVDEKGKPLDIVLRERGVAERLIESFMLAANETVARHYEQLHVPFMYRIHENPSQEKLQRFLEFITVFGVTMKGSVDQLTPKKLQQALDEVKGEEYEAVVSTMMLRSMKQAKYAIEPSGHFGLAASDYTHFTSPIRRYPDLIVHRLIRMYQEKGILWSEQQFSELESTLEFAANQSSNRERRAVEAERQTDALKKAEFMEDKVGQTFEGIISSVTKFGMFVELPNTIEGLIHISQIKGDYFNFIESHMLLLGERTGKTYRIGDRVQVTLMKVDVEAKQIDFLLAEDAVLETKKQKTLPKINQKKLKDTVKESKKIKKGKGRKRAKRRK